MAVATGVTLSTDLDVIVDDIREKAFELSVKTGVYKNFIPEVGAGKKGSSISIPRWNPNGALVAAVATEGQEIGDATAYANDKVTLTSVETYVHTLITDNDREDANDDVKARHITAHGIGLGKNVENQAQAAAIAGFTKQLVCTKFDLAHIVRMRTTIEASQLDGQGNFGCFANAAMYEDLVNSMVDNGNYGVRGDAGNEFLKNYIVRTVLGDVDLYKTDSITDFTAATLNGVFMRKDAMCMWVPRRYNLETKREATLRADRIISTQRYGFAVREDHLGMKFTAPNTLLAAVGSTIPKVEIANTSANPVNTKAVA